MRRFDSGGDRFSFFSFIHLIYHLSLSLFVCYTLCCLANHLSNLSRDLLSHDSFINKKYFYSLSKKSARLFFSNFLLVKKNLITLILIWVFWVFLFEPWTMSICITIWWWWWWVNIESLQFKIFNIWIQLQNEKWEKFSNNLQFHNKSFSIVFVVFIEEENKRRKIDKLSEIIMWKRSYSIIACFRSHNLHFICFFR